MPPKPSTFSIVARDLETEAVGVAVQSKFVSVGSVVPFASAETGAIATQSFANVSYGPDGLSLLREGRSAEEVIELLTDRDEESAQRQVGVVGQDGSVAAFTGTDCLAYAGDRQGETYSVQGNVLENEATLDAMADAFERENTGFPERLLAALRAGNEAGGDSRGEQAAALYVSKSNGGYDGGNDRWIDVRVDDHERPIAELERVFKIYDVTLLEREAPENTTSLDGESAREVRDVLSILGFDGGHDGPSNGGRGGEFTANDREALAEFQGTNNFENHSLVALEDAIARGWEETEGVGKDRLIDAIWVGLSRLDRK